MTPRPVAQSLFPDVMPDRPVGPLPLSVQTGTNADLMYAIKDLYLTGSVLDVTYGRGGWWQRFTPDPFTFHDLALDGVDFRSLPEADGSVDTVCFDPPYITTGPRSQSGQGVFLDYYGLGEATKRNNEGYAAFEADLRSGLAEAIRVSRRWVLVKCMEFTTSAFVVRGLRFFDLPYKMTTWALELDAVKHDQIVLGPSTGPGGHNIWEAKRCRRAHSYLLVFAVPT